MPPIPFADNFLAGSLLTILLPIGLLIAIAIWYVVLFRRVPEDTPVTSPSLPSAKTVTAADRGVDDAQGGVTPTGS